MTAAETTELEPEDARSIVVERLLNAPQRLVFEVFTEASHLARWWGPDGFSITTHAFDFRVGGRWRFTMHGPDGRDYENGVVFDVIEPPSRIIARNGDAADLEPANHEMRIALSAEGSRTRLVWRLVFPTIADMERVAREYGAVEGCHQTTQRLADYVAGIAGAA